jgi:hypothetical protein
MGLAETGREAMVEQGPFAVGLGEDARGGLEVVGFVLLLVVIRGGRTGICVLPSKQVWEPKRCAAV